MKNAFRKKCPALLLCACLLLSLWGCGGRELYERLLIHGIGVDAEDGGFLVTVRSSTSPEDEGEEYFRCRGRTVLEALNSLSLSTGRQPFYAHNYLVVFGRACAEQGLDSCLDFFVRYYNTRPAVRAYLAEGKAEDVLGFQKDGKYLKMAELQQLGDSSAETGRAVRVEILDLINGARRRGSSPVMPVLRAGEEKVELVSTAYFDGFTLKGFLTPEATRGLLAAKGRLKHGEAVVAGSFGAATLSFSGSSASVRADCSSGGAPTFTVEITARADVSSLAGKTRLTRAEYDDLETLLARQLREEALLSVEQAVLRDRCDVFGFGALLYRQDPAYWQTVSSHWQDLMARSKYAFTVTARISRLEQEE